MQGYFFGCVLGSGGFWLAFFSVFGSGFRGFVSLVCMAQCCFLRVVVLNSC